MILKKRLFFADYMKTIAGLFLTLNFFACVSIPKCAVAVKPFDKDKYLGTWYEIARFDFTFERGLSHVTANYSLKSPGIIRVDNKGYQDAKSRWKESIGKARFVGSEDVGRLKVSFFGPFYAGYNVIALDNQYRYALIAGDNLNYLWILSREKTIPETVKNEYLQKAKSLGYDIDRLIWTKQD